MLGFPIVVMDGDTKIERRLGERLSVIIGFIGIMGGMIILFSPLPWDLRSYVPGCYEQSEYRQRFHHDSEIVPHKYLDLL